MAARFGSALTLRLVWRLILRQAAALGLTKRAAHARPAAALCFSLDVLNQQGPTKIQKILGSVAASVRA